MGYLESDVYYQPEKFGLTPVGEIDWDVRPYEFNITAVWVDEDKNIYFADDSGCSCPSPFEWATSLDKVTKAESLQELIDHLEEQIPLKDSRYDEPDNRNRVIGEVGELIFRVREAIR